MPIWDEAVKSAIRRQVARTGSRTFTRRDLINSEIGAIIEETRTRGGTPAQTLGRELQQLRDTGLVAFVERGSYRWLGEMPDPQPDTPSKGVFLLGPDVNAGEPERYHRLPAQWLRTATRMIGEWIIYQASNGAEERGYRAVAKVEAIDPDPDRKQSLLVEIARGSYLEFGRPVPLERDGTMIERGLLNVDGSVSGERAVQPVRVLSQTDFDRIIDLGLITEEELLPRIDAGEGGAIVPQWMEERSVWEGPLDRTQMLVSRKVRDRQFRKRVLDVYGSRCALTGMKLLNGGGRVETEAAHIMSVEAGGPDAVDNGIALSGTIHWMFDRGLISLSDTGDILLSRGINDRESVERLIFPDRRARLPIVAAHRPHPRFLHWHRTVCFHE